MDQTRWKKNFLKRERKGRKTQGKSSFRHKIEIEAQKNLFLVLYIYVTEVKAIRKERKENPGLKKMKLDTGAVKLDKTEDAIIPFLVITTCLPPTFIKNILNLSKTIPIFHLLFMTMGISNNTICCSFNQLIQPQSVPIGHKNVPFLMGPQLYCAAYCFKLCVYVKAG